jgi:hypothetical protein
MPRHHTCEFKICKVWTKDYCGIHITLPEYEDRTMEGAYFTVYRGFTSLFTFETHGTPAEKTLTPWLGPISLFTSLHSSLLSGWALRGPIALFTSLHFTSLHSSLLSGWALRGPIALFTPH